MGVLKLHMVKYRNLLYSYNCIIATLQNNDRNATYDEIIDDYTLVEAVDCLYRCIDRIILEEDMEGDELAFYVEQLARVKKIMIGVVI